MSDAAASAASAASAAYGPVDRLLHRLALGVPAIAEMSFSVDRALNRPDPEAAARGRHVFVSGLARAGTTIIMRRLHASGAFRSLTYRDMPFVLAPTLWRKLAGKNGGTAGAETERAHGDGLRVGADSPESLDEVFWRVFCGADYIRHDHLAPHAPDGETIAAFRAYVAAILGAGDADSPGRYLSKNNNNILRLPGILQAFPNATVLVPFRAPLEHAASLRDQHRRFSALHAEDRFGRRYMDWLAHHEFGAGHRPFRFAADAPPLAGNPDTLDYWLDLWIRTYDWLLAHEDPRIAFVSYDALCADPAEWDRVAALTGAPPPPEGVEALEVRSREIAETADGGMIAAAHEIYDALDQRTDGRSGFRESG